MRLAVAVRRMLCWSPAVFASALVLATLVAQRALPTSLDLEAEARATPRLLDRHGRVLDLRYDGSWNLDERVALEQIPPLLRAAFLAAEDRRFFEHAGVDWHARAAAVWQNLRAGRRLRGASTISEQVVRLLHPRPRTLWSRWVEGFEALRLELRFAKPDILEFYLNQVPYGANRRGVLAAARHHFGRDLETLAPQEMLALAVLVRAPSRLAREPEALQAGVARLARRLGETGALAATEVARVTTAPLALRATRAPLTAFAFAREARRRAASDPRDGRALRTSLDPSLQRDAEDFLRHRLQDLAPLGVAQGALLAVELADNRVRAWASADAADPLGIGIDAVLAPRQPGSTLKPLLYALALERGWTADTPIEDAPLAEHINRGLHQYRNYSRVHYGRVSLREALGNSLNVPAVKTLRFVGGAEFLARLRTLGIKSLARPWEAYGDGLALGNGELSLFELVQAYGALARGGRWQPLALFEDANRAGLARQVIAPAAAREISSILADPQARRLEFGDGAALRFARRTAVKTGTSTDYRDAWTVAYDGRHLVGVWMGNLSGGATAGVTGATGPALLARAMLARLAQEPGRETVAQFMPSALPPPLPTVAATASRADAAPAFAQPQDGLQLALDARIPDALEAFEFVLEVAEPVALVTWHVGGDAPAHTREPRWLWPLRRGAHHAWAEVALADGRQLRTAEVRFEVR